MRASRRCSLVVSGRNIMLDTVLEPRELSDILEGMCQGSLYAFSETINQGYISLPHGIRVGVCGRATSEGGRIIGVREISSLSIRIPSKIINAGDEICDLIDSFDRTCGVLIYAPPGEGKTTLLTSIALKMAGGEHPKRVCVIDTRGELAASLRDRELCLDVLSGYPRGLGIDIATRTMSPELIVCDEIGDTEEAEAIISAQNSGVPFVASAHADNVEGLLRRTAIARLHGARVFFAYIGIKRAVGDFIYTVNEWEEADAIFHGSGSDSSCIVWA